MLPEAAIKKSKLRARLRKPSFLHLGNFRLYLSAKWIKFMCVSLQLRQRWFITPQSHVITDENIDYTSVKKFNNASTSYYYLFRCILISVPSYNIHQHLQFILLFI